MGLITIKKHLTRFLILFSIPGIQSFPSFAMENHLTGARSLGLSHATVSFSDTWSTFHNQAGLAGLNNISAGFYYESKFGVPELSLAAGSAVLPVNPGTFGFSFFQFGEKIYKETKFGLTFARRLSKKWSAGIQLDYLAQRLPENERARGFVAFEGGILFRPLEKLVLGTHVFNPVSEDIASPAGKKKMPVVFRIGGHYCFDENILVTVETEKDNQNPALFKSGIEFLSGQNLTLRMGVSGKPFRYTAGMGYKTDKINADIGFSYHGNLGITPSVSVQFQW